jgi:hypothetical protein
MVRPIVVAVLALLIPNILNAQARGTMAVAPHAMPATPQVRAASPRLTSPQVITAPGSAPHVGRAIGTQHLVGARSGVGTAVRAGGPRSGPRITSRSTVRGGNGRRRHFENDDRRLTPGCSSVPGLGFDVPHLAATCGPDAVGGGRRSLQSSFFFPILDGGFFVPGAPAFGEDAAASEAQPSEEDVRVRGRRVRVSPEEPASVSQPEVTPVGESSEYVFVRRDGTVFFAVAFTWENGTLRYVTSEGLRRAVARDSLDLNATQQFNEQRGLNFQSPG